MVTWTGQFPPSPEADIERGVQEAQDYFRVSFPSSFLAVATVLDKGVIPFAEDIGGDLFCFSYRDDYDSPPVVFWSTDTGAVRLAANFDDFVGTLRE